MSEYIIISPEADEFWEATATGRLLVQKCNACGEVFLTPRAFCPQCMSPEIEWIEASGLANLYSYTSVNRGNGITGESPYILALVDLEEGPRLMTNLVECAVEDLTPDMTVEVCFGPKISERTYPLFRPHRSDDP